MSLCSIQPNENIKPLRLSIVQDQGMKSQKSNQPPLSTQKSDLIVRKTVSDIQLSFEPQRAIVDDMMGEMNGSIDNMFSAVNTYNQILGTVPQTKTNIQKILRIQYPFFQKQLSQADGMTEKTKNCTAYLHEGVLFRQGSRANFKGQTKFELMSKALSSQPIERNQRKKVQFQDLNRKREVMKMIQKRIDEDDVIKKQVIEQRQQKEQSKLNQDDNIGQLTLDMIANLRQKYFTELVSDNKDDKYKKLKQLRENFIPHQIEEVMKQNKLQQKSKLKQEMVSKHSHFNAYYQLLALEGSMQRVIKLKLKGELTSYSRFQGFKSLDNHSSVISPVREYINAYSQKETNPTLSS